MTFSGCVLPLSPTWEDPAKETNYAPQVVGTVPVEGFVLPQTLTVTVTDPNVGDHVYVRWIAEYPPYNPMKTRLLRDDVELAPPADGTPVFAMPSVANVSCLNLAPQTSAHPVTALVTDRAFPKPSETPGTNPQDLFTKLDSNGLSAEAHWVLNVDCP